MGGILDPVSGSAPNGVFWNALGMKSVTVAAGQIVQWTVSAALGSTVGASGLDITACYTDAGGTPHEAFAGQFMEGLTVAAGQRHVFSTTAYFLFAAAGTYSVGLCGVDTSNSGNWNSNDFFNVTALILAAGTPHSSPVQGGPQRPRN
jgi:hypothetical protein